MINFYGLTKTSFDAYFISTLLPSKKYYLKVHCLNSYIVLLRASFGKEKQQA